jgi:hypothetical protein
MKPEVNHLWIGRENPLRTPYGFHRPFVASRPQKKHGKTLQHAIKAGNGFPGFPKFQIATFQMAFEGKSMKYNEIILQYRKHLTLSIFCPMVL